MSKFVPYEKASKKRQRAYDSSVRILTSKNMSDKSSIIPSAKNQQVFNVESVEKSNDGMTDTYNEEEIE